MSEDVEITETVYAVVEDSLHERCVVKTLWLSEAEAERYAKDNKLRVVRWAVLRKTGGKPL